MSPLLHILGVSIAGVALSWLLGLTSLKRHALLGGMLAGLALGPAVLGRVAPSWFEQEIIGGVEERLALDEATRTNTANMMVLEHIDAPTAETFQAREEAQSAERERRAQLDRARLNHQQPARILVFCMAATMMLVGATQSRVTSHSVARPDWYAPLSIGLWSAALPAGLTLLVLRWFEFDWPESLAVCAAVAVGPLAQATTDQQVADEAEVGGAPLMRAASRYAMWTATALLVAAALFALRATHHQLIPWMLWATPAVVLVSSLFRLPRMGSGFSRALEFVLIPAVAACTMARVEVFIHWNWWLVLALLILCGDGRWLGALLGAILCGARRTLPSMRLVLASMGAVTSQLGVTACALSAGVIDESAALALLAGALLMDLTTNTRQRVADQLKKTETELNETENRID